MQHYRQSRRKERIADESEQLEAVELLSKYSRSRSSNVSPSQRASMGSVDDRTGNNQKPLELPLVPIRKVLAKIGGIPKPTYVPTPEEYDSRHNAKYQELKRMYYGNVKRHQPFQCELDEIVLDCYEYGKNFGRDTIWRKYKQNFDDLTYDTLRAIHNKRRL